jgi:tRNA (cytidine/uridine-2'-O-)-methyltransferase
VDLWVHPSWREFREAVSRDRCLYFSAHGRESYLGAPFTANSALVFGNETLGLPERIREKHPERVYRIPMRPAVRSLNLATAVGIVLYESLRRVGVELEPPEQDAHRPEGGRIQHETHRVGPEPGQGEA